MSNDVPSNAAMSVSELRKFAKALSREAFIEQVGPFVLVQSPPQQMVQKMARLLGARPTFARGDDVRIDGFAQLISRFDSLQVATLPPVRSEDALCVGRLPDNELVVDDPSVSRRHAIVRWEHELGRCVVEDQGSRNGTWVNASSTRGHPTEVSDGDLVSFGDSTFIFFRTESLYLRLLGTDEAFEVVSVDLGEDAMKDFRPVAIAEPIF